MFNHCILQLPFFSTIFHFYYPIYQLSLHHSQHSLHFKFKLSNSLHSSSFSILTSKLYFTITNNQLTSSTTTYLSQLATSLSITYSSISFLSNHNQSHTSTYIYILLLPSKHHSYNPTMPSREPVSHHNLERTNQLILYNY